MKRFLTENLLWKVLSVFLAFLIWVAIAREPELATSVSVPIFFRNLPNQLDLASDVPERVHLELRGPAPRLTPASLAQTAVVLDMSLLQAGERTFNIQDRDIRQLPAGVVFYRAVPSQVTLRFEHLISKSVPIEPTYLKPPAEGYYVLNYSFDPPKIQIQGPSNRMANIDHVVTDPVDLSAAGSEASFKVHVRLGDPQVRMVSPSEVRLQVTLKNVTRQRLEVDGAKALRHRWHTRGCGRVSVGSRYGQLRRSGPRQLGSERK